MSEEALMRLILALEAQTRAINALVEALVGDLDEAPDEAPRDTYLDGTPR